MTKRKKYSREFKLDAVSLVTEQDYTRVEKRRGAWVLMRTCCVAGCRRWKPRMAMHFGEMANLHRSRKRFERSRPK